MEVSPVASKRNRKRSTLVRRHTTIVQEVKAPEVTYASFTFGLVAGVTQAGLFNPFDRALYLSVTNRVPFLLKENFRTPYQGFAQSVGHRALSGGLYYPLEQFFMTLTPTNFDDNDPWAQHQQHSRSSQAFYNFLAGTAAGATNAVIINPMSAVKYKTWGREVNRGFWIEAKEMLRKGGLRPFLNGLYPTIVRDLVFGGCYTFLRLEIQYRLQLSNDSQWMANMGAAALATIASGPFNLARNVQYATKSRDTADSMSQVLISLGKELRDQPTVWKKLKHTQQRLRIGWGTARVALGMSFGHWVYDRLHGMYEQHKRQERLQERLNRR